MSLVSIGIARLYIKHFDSSRKSVDITFIRKGSILSQIIKIEFIKVYNKSPD